MKCHSCGKENPPENTYTHTVVGRENLYFCLNNCPAAYIQSVKDEDKIKTYKREKRKEKMISLKESKIKRNLKPFLEELTQLSIKYRISIEGCGCCGSPSLNYIKTKESKDCRYKTDGIDCLTFEKE